MGACKIPVEPQESHQVASQARTQGIQAAQGLSSGDSLSLPLAKELKILYLNACSLIYKVVPLEALITMTEADVVLVTETHYPPDYNPSIKNFNLICSATRKDTEYGAFGGSAIFVRKSPQIVMNFATISSTSDDCTIAHSMINYTNFVLIYRSPNQAKCDMKKLMNYL